MAGRGKADGRINESPPAVISTERPIMSENNNDPIDPLKEAAKQYYRDNPGKQGQRTANTLPSTVQFRQFETSCGSCISRGKRSMPI